MSTVSPPPSSVDLKKIKSRKWLVTINNPVEHGFTHEAIKAALSCIKGDVYWCLCDEEGDECETLHTHVFIFRPNAITAQRINNLFPSCHRDICNGTTQDNRDYVRKEGEKFNKDESGHYNYTDSSKKVHKGINYTDTFEENKDCPIERQGKQKDADLIVELIKDGASDAEIIDTVASAFKDIDRIQRTRSIYRDSPFRDTWRNLEVTYIFGKTGTGKTRSVMERFGYSAVYRVTDYKHPFDTYDGQDVIIFEEFRSSLKHGDMLNYLDGYPVLLPCRYFNRQACFTKVFIISNIPPDSQYTGVDKASRDAFFRRIHTIIHYDGKCVSEYKGIKDFMSRYDWAKDLHLSTDLQNL